MGLGNCDLCGKIFTHFGNQRRCTPCLEAQERDWKLVRDYVKSNPGVNLLQVVEATEVPERRIREFILAGLLEPSQMNGVAYPCRKCNQPIATGDYCPTCMAKVGQQLSQNLQDSRPRPASTSSSQSESRSGFATQYRSRHR